LLMLQLAGIPRTLLRLIRLLGPALLVCACASVADASPRAARHTGQKTSRSHENHASRRAARLRQIMRFGQTHNLCSSQLTLSALERQSTQQAGPVAHRFVRNGGLTHHTPTRFKRDVRSRVNDAEAAIQNDAPAARVGCNENVTPALRSLGVLASFYDRLPALDAASPRSPRGPPRII
jgi:hypothetical protein